MQSALARKYASASTGEQLSPGDVAYRCFRTKPVQAVLAQGVSLYKMRKARFVAQVVVRLLLAAQGRTERAPHQAGARAAAPLQARERGARGCWTGRDSRCRQSP